MPQSTYWQSWFNFMPSAEGHEFSREGDSKMFGSI
jgi:hypothetical protein